MDMNLVQTVVDKCHSCRDSSKSYVDKGRLNTFFEEILKTSSVDYCDKEIEDIQTAVRELLERIVGKINERGLFNISRIEPCGSMAEKTALWKTLDKDKVKETTTEKYLEFDFLAILEKTSDIKISERCAACMGVHGPPTDFRLLHKCGYSKWVKKGLMFDANYSNPNVIDELFKREVSASVVSFCNCLTVQDGKGTSLRTKFPDYVFIPKFDHLRHVCNKCNIYKPSGHLELALWTPLGKSSDDVDSCTLILYWESKSSSLLAPVWYNINRTQNMKRFQIHIDFIPAFEATQEARNGYARECDQACLIVSKCCPVFDIRSAWRISGCLVEVNAFTNRISKKHKKCYMLLKYIFRQKKGKQLPNKDSGSQSRHSVYGCIRGHCDLCS